MKFANHAGKQLKKYRKRTLNQKNPTEIIKKFNIPQNTYYRQEKCITDWEFLFKFLSHHKVDLNRFFELEKFFTNQQDTK